MKFILIPLLIAGMFISFAAALMAMLFWDGTIENLEELKKLIMGGVDSTRLPVELLLKEDKLDTLFSKVAGYQELYEAQLRSVAQLEDSLNQKLADNTKIEDDLLLLTEQVEGKRDSALMVQRAKNLDDLAKYYNAMKPALAAEILQEEGELSDTMVAEIIKRLDPARAGKTMGFMDTEYAARITKIMQEL